MRISIGVLLLFLLQACQGGNHQTDFSIELDRIVAELAREAKKDGLTLIGSGGGIQDEHIREISASFQTYSVLSVEEARILLVNLSDMLTQIVTTKPSYEKCFLPGQSLNSRFSIAVFGSSPRDKTLSYITSVRKRNDCVVYSKLDISERVQPAEKIHRETFAEAVAIVKGE